MGENDKEDGFLAEIIESDFVKKKMNLLKKKIKRLSEKAGDGGYALIKSPQLMYEAIFVMFKKKESSEGITDQYYIKRNKSYKKHRMLLPREIYIYICLTSADASTVRTKELNYDFTEDDNVSVHAIINHTDGKIYQTLPWNYRGSHRFSARDAYNIGLVVLDNKKTSDVGSSIQVPSNYNSLVVLVAWLCTKYRIPVNNNGIVIYYNDARTEDISDWLGTPCSKEQFLGNVKDQMKQVLTDNELKDNYFAS